jgi:hypothetical protein
MNKLQLWTTDPKSLRDHQVRNVEDTLKIPYLPGKRDDSFVYQHSYGAIFKGG